MRFIQARWNNIKYNTHCWAIKRFHFLIEMLISIKFFYVCPRYNVYILFIPVKNVLNSFAISTCSSTGSSKNIISLRELNGKKMRLKILMKKYKRHTNSLFFHSIARSLATRQGAEVARARRERRIVSAHPFPGSPRFSVTVQEVGQS